MTDKEILQKAIEKIGKQFNYAPLEANEVEWDELMNSESYYAIIFTSVFAKAFWGEDLEEGPLWKIYQPPKAGDLVVYVGTYALKWGEESEPTVGFIQVTLPEWQHHLQIMVLEENPIKYLEQFL